MMTGSLPKELYIFVGPPGSGKGSLASMCVQRMGWEMLSTGNLCRKHLAEQTEIGREIDFAIKSGKLVSDDLISRMVEHWFIRKDGGDASVILDGYPRTLKQAETFDSLLKSYDKKLKLFVVVLNVSDAVVVERLSSRFTCSNKECQAVYSVHANSSCMPKTENVCDKCGCNLIRRDDDEPVAICKRLQIYHQHAKDVVNFYLTMGYSIVEIDGEKPLEQVFEEFVKRIGIANI